MQKLNGFGDSTPVNERWLDSTLFTEGLCESKVGLVIDVKSSYSKDDKQYGVFYVKDCNGLVTRCMLFNLQDLSENRMTLSSFKNRPVLLPYRVTVFQGQWSLIIDNILGITEWKGAFDRKKFLGVIDVDYSQINSISESFNPNGNGLSEFKDKSNLHICGGRVNGLIKLYENVSSSLFGLANLATYDVKVAMEVLDICIREYWHYLVLKEKSEIVAMNNALGQVLNVSATYASHNYNPFIVDTLSALFDLKKPNTIYGYLISKYVKESLYTFDLLYKYQSSVLDSVISIDGGVQLLKYHV